MQAARESIGSDVRGVANGGPVARAGGLEREMGAYEAVVARLTGALAWAATAMRVQIVPSGSRLVPAGLESPEGAE